MLVWAARPGAREGALGMVGWPRDVKRSHRAGSVRITPNGILILSR